MSEIIHNSVVTNQWISHKRNCSVVVSSVAMAGLSIDIISHNFI